LRIAPGWGIAFRSATLGSWEGVLDSVRDTGESLLSILVDAGPTVAPRICRSHTFSDEAKPSSQTIVISIGPRSDECRLTRQSQVERVGYRVPIRHSVLHVAPMLDNHVVDMCCTAASVVLRR
jgi:hypothetical protein